MSSPHLHVKFQMMPQTNPKKVLLMLAMFCLGKLEGIESIVAGRSELEVILIARIEDLALRIGIIRLKTDRIYTTLE